ncbi:MAG: histidine kinase [Bacteroidota bacterium]|nr:histidine kinase [Bacteroidota bacterium]
MNIRPKDAFACLKARIWMKVLLGLCLGAFTSFIEWLDGCTLIMVVYNVSFSVIGSVLIWSGSEFIAFISDHKYKWEVQPLRRVLFLIIFNLIYIIIIIELIFVTITWLKGEPVPARFYFQTFVNCIVITLIINLIYITFDLYQFWKNSRSEVETLKKENLKSQLESLKNQINPHFLFNSLNTLISVIDDQPEVAKNYTQSLSQVYRYILQAREKEISTLQEELSFLDAYNYLLKIRFGDNLNFQIEIEQKYRDSKIPSLVLQTLVENCIKHNIISASKPLTVSLLIEDDKFLIIRNNLQVKKLNVESEKVGLKNTNERFRLALGKEIEVTTDDEYFTVKLPILS